MHIITQAVVNRLRAHPAMGLLEALQDTHVFRLATARFLLIGLEEVLPVNEWRSTRGRDAIAALELADP